MRERLPEIKRTISSYISEENGRITKHSLLSLGAILASAAIASVKIQEASAQTLHQHSHIVAMPHSSHGSHGSHSSY